VGLVGKTVKISNMGLLEFFYPRFRVKDHLFFDANNSVIYVGESRPDLLEYLGRGTKEFINTVGISDIDLDVRDRMLDFVYEKHNKVPKSDVVDSLKNVTDRDFEQYIKKYWVSGYSTLDDDCEYSIFDLYKAMGNSNRESLKIFYELRKSYEAKILKRSVETFLEKVVDVDTVNVSNYYLKILKEFNKRYRSKLKSVLYQYYFKKGDSEYKVVWLLSQFGGNLK
jgi:hypothetical protein